MNTCCCKIMFPLHVYVQTDRQTHTCLIVFCLLPVSQDILMQEELSTYTDEVFESPSEAAMKEAETSGKKDEAELTGSALDKTELERSHLML